MGTRNLTAVYLDGDCKVAQYGQWDGYPEGQGVTALEFLRSADLDDFRDAVRRCRWATDEEGAAISKEFTNDGWMNMEQSNRFQASRWGHLSRDHGAKILQLIADSPSGLALNNEIGFAADSCFCEWAYVIDLDKGLFEVYKGFNQEPLEAGERFAAMEGDKGYYPVKLEAKWLLSDLPSEEEFLRLLDREEVEA